MKAGHGHSKGAAFERVVCKRLSLWLTQGKEEDVFWRSAMSGGRATRLVKKGKRGGNAAGDICATGEAGHQLTDYFFIECKFYANLDLIPFLLQRSTGKLQKFWDQACLQAKSHSRSPMLIAKQNLIPAFVIVNPMRLKDAFWQSLGPPLLMIHNLGIGLYWLDDLFPLPTSKPKLKRRIKP